MKGTTATLIAIVFLLAIFGIVMVASTSLIYADDFADAGNFTRHLLWITLALSAMLVMMRVDYHWLAKHSPWVLAAAALLLVAVLVPGIGTRINGARRWIRVGGFSVQPSEIAKFALILFVATWLTREAGRARSLNWGFLPVLGVTGFVAGLIVLEPDLGTSMLILLVGVTLGILAGFRWLHIAPLVLPMVPFFYVFVWRVPWRQERLFAFMDPWKYYDGAGYQLCQALVALGHGAGVRAVGRLVLADARAHHVRLVAGLDFGRARALAHDRRVRRARFLLHYAGSTPSGPRLCGGGSAVRRPSRRPGELWLLETVPGWRERPFGLQADN